MSPLQVLKKKYDKNMTELKVYFNIDTKNKIKRDDSGFASLDVFTTRTGIFLYFDNKGRIIRDLRPPDEVFNKDSMMSLSNRPITNNHPDEQLVNSTNAKKYTVGWTSSDVVKSGDKLLTKAIISDEAAIQSIESGKVEASCGYTCTYDNTSGVWNGQEYDRIQRNIKYNHVAIVDKGRAGPEVRFKTDSDESTNIIVDSSDYVIDHLRYDPKIVFDEKSKKFSDDDAILCEVVISKTVVDNKEKAREIAQKFGVVSLVNETKNAFRFVQNANSSGEKFSYVVGDERGATLIFTKIKNDIILGGSAKMAEISINNVSQEVSEEFKAEYDKYISELQDKISMMSEKLSAVETAQIEPNQAEVSVTTTDSSVISGLQAKADVLEKENKELKAKIDSLPEEIRKYAKEYTQVASIANDFLDKEMIQKIDSMSVDEIKVEVVKASKIDVADKPKAYIDAAFDLIALNSKSAGNKSLEIGKEILKTRQDSATVNKASEARERAFQNSKELWKTSLSNKKS